MLEPGPYVMVDLLYCRDLGGGRSGDARFLGAVMNVTGPATECACCVACDLRLAPDGRHAEGDQFFVVRPENLRPLRDPDAEDVEEREAETA